jgi:hypothetical protein
MCEFLSVLVVRNGDVRHHPMLDSHSDLIAYFNLPDDRPYHQHFAKAELTPRDWLDPDTWTWRIDEETRPSWLDDVEAGAEKKTRAIARRMILTDVTRIPKLIVDGCWIVGGKAVVRDVRGGRIIRVQDTARLETLRGSAQVTDVGGSAQVTDVGDSAQVTDVGDSAQVTDVWGSAQVTDVGDSARVTHVRGSAQVTDVGGSAQVTDVGAGVHLDDSAKAHLVKA